MSHDPPPTIEAVVALARTAAAIRARAPIVPVDPAPEHVDTVDP